MKASLVLEGERMQQHFMRQAGKQLHAAGGAAPAPHR
jgi:hypothetical protein